MIELKFYEDFEKWECPISSDKEQELKEFAAQAMLDISRNLGVGTEDFIDAAKSGIPITHLVKIAMQAKEKKTTMVAIIAGRKLLGEELV